MGKYRGEERDQPVHGEPKTLSRAPDKKEHAPDDRQTHDGPQGHKGGHSPGGGRGQRGLDEVVDVAKRDEAWNERGQKGEGLEDRHEPSPVTEAPGQGPQDEG